MTEQQQYPYQPAPPAKKGHRVRNVFIVLAVIFVVMMGGCVAFIVAVGNEAAKDTEATPGRSTPRSVVVGQAFTIGKHQTLAGWKVINTAGEFDVTGKVQNISDRTSTAFFHVKLLHGDEVVGNVMCNSSDLEPRQIGTLNCIPDGDASQSFDRVTAEATF
jgi:hypothetical protein